MAISLGVYFGARVFLCVVAAAGSVATITIAIAAMWFEKNAGPGARRYSFDFA